MVARKTAASEIERPHELESFFTRPKQVQRLAPCIGNCPNGTDIRGWVATIGQRAKLGFSKEESYRRAWQQIVQHNPFPATTGRICPHPCEDTCNRTYKEGPVAINAMERFLGDWAITQKLPLPRLDDKPKSQTIGVVGSGPAGLSLAYQMARRGYPVTIYEQYASPGGMLRYGIPRYRLPEHVLNAEIQRILDLGVDLKVRTSVGKDISVGELMSRHSSIFVGIGAQKGLCLGIPGEAGPGVWTGTDLLRKLNQGEQVDLGAHVAVIGGGNTACDAARAARRCGAQVTMLYRRTREEMPAHAQEIEDALREQVSIEYLASPTAVLRNGDSVKSLRVQKMKLGEPDKSGRRRPMPVDGSEFELPVSAVVAAVSQEPDWENISELKPEESSLTAGPDGSIGHGLWAGGDALQAGIASQAIFQGRLAAERVHAKLSNVAPLPLNHEEPIRHKKLRLDYYEKKTRLTAPERPVERWLAEPMSEVRLTISEVSFLDEVSRCLSCGSCLGCEHCAMYCNPHAFIRSPEARPGAYFALVLDQCEGCSKCIEVCPCGFLTPIE